MYISLRFQTARFCLCADEIYYKPELRPGEDVMLWLRGHLRAAGYMIGDPRQVGADWVMPIDKDGRSYELAGRCLRSGREFPILDWAEWRLQIGRRRSFFDRLRLRRRLARQDPLAGELRVLLNRHFENVFQELCWRCH